MDTPDRGNGRSWLDLQRAAGWDTGPIGPEDDALGAALGRMLHVDDVERLRFFQAVTEAADLADTERGRRLGSMLHFSLFDARTPFTGIEASLTRLLANRSRAEELRELS